GGWRYQDVLTCSRNKAKESGMFTAARRKLMAERLPAIKKSSACRIIKGKWAAGALGREESSSMGGFGAQVHPIPGSARDGTHATGKSFGNVENIRFSNSSAKEATKILSGNESPVPDFFLRTLTTGAGGSIN